MLPRTHLALFVACLLGSPMALAANATPEAQTQALIDALKEVKGGAVDAALTARLDAFFDYDTLMTNALGPQKSQLDAAQLTTYKDTFGKLIRAIAYPDSGEFLREAKLTLKPAKTIKDRVHVSMDAYLAKEDFETTVTFIWAKRDKAHAVVDLAFDDASLVADYQNQFGRVITKDGVDGLLKKLDDKLADVKKGAEKPKK